MASGTVESSPVASVEWAPKYEAKVGSIQRRANPIPVELLRDRIPNWKYPKYARGYTTVPIEFHEALEQLLRLDRPYDIETGISADEVEDLGPYLEGSVRQVTVNAYERNPEARRKCIQHYGTDCGICGFNFGKVYGPVADGLIHVHHLRSLSEIGEEYEVDPVADLRPVCANCHAVLHRRPRPYSIEEVRAFLAQQEN